jgi:chemotaxis protein MotB
VASATIDTQDVRKGESRRTVCGSARVSIDATATPGIRKRAGPLLARVAPASTPVHCTRKPEGDSMKEGTIAVTASAAPMPRSRAKDPATLIAVLLLVHGISHVPGFLSAWGFEPLQPYKTTIFDGAVDVGSVGIRLVGALWLLTAVGFVAASIGAFARGPRWIGFAAGLCVVSLVLSTSEWPAARYGAVVDVVLLCLLVLSQRSRARLAGSVAVLSLLPLVGCVSESKYDDLKHMYDVARADLGERQVQIGTLEQTLQDERDKSKQLTAQLESLQQQVALIEQQRNETAAEILRLQQEELRLNGDLASLVKDRSRLKQSTEQLQLALAELSARKVEAERRVAEFRTLLSRFKNLIDAGTLRVTIADGRMVLQLPTDVLFDSGSARLSKVGQETVGQVALVLKDMPERRFQIEGHTDNVPIHNAQYRSNWELAAGRALGVVRAMSDAGMQGTLLSAASYGEYHPTASNDNETNRKENRRIEIVLVPDLSMLPGFQELTSIVDRK